MRPRSTLTLAALVLGAACASVPALAQSRQSNPSYSNTGPYSGAPLSPKLLLKAGIATAIAAVLWVGFYILIAFGVFDL